MPGCYRANEERRDHQFEKDDWPEPPGYLGEAVRRAKRIARALRAMRQVPDTD